MLVGGDVAVYARDAGLPSGLQGWIAAYGAGFVEQRATFAVSWGAQRVRVQAVASAGVILEYGGRVVSSVGDGWQLLRIDAPASGDIIVEGSGWLHGVWVEPLPDEPSEPDEPDEPSEPALAGCGRLLAYLCGLGWLRHRKRASDD